MGDTVKAQVVGATGYTGGELLRLLKLHEKTGSITATSRQYAGEKISSIHPNLSGIYGEKFTEFNPEKTDADIVFLCVPHTKAMGYVPQLLESGHKVIDLSADYRISDPGLYEKHYCIHENPELLEKAVYGLPELNRKKIRKTNLVANPGCYATAAILGLLPLMGEEGLELDKVVVDAKSGTSGAGAKPNKFLHASQVESNLKPYKVTGHRHQPEIQHILSGINPNVSINFTPTLMPFSRGIQETIHVFGEIENPREKYEKHYEEDPFIRVVDDSFVKNVAYSNYCDIAVFQDTDKNRLVTVSSIDNLMKGASGQAVQNMNLMMGYDESTGLQTIPYNP